MDRELFRNALSRPALSGRRLWKWWRNRRKLWKMRRFYAEFIKPGDLVFDVGAHIGSRSRLFLDLGAQVVAVEPQTACARRLLLTFHSHPNFSLVHKALGAMDDWGELFLADRTVSATLSAQWVAMPKPQAYGNIAWAGAQKVQITTLDALIEQFGLPRFVKIDAEFSEYEILRGLSHSLPAFSFEYHLTYLEPALLSLAELSRFGPVEVNLSRAESFEWVFDQWTRAERVSDFLSQQTQKTDFGWGDVYVRAVG